MSELNIGFVKQCVDDGIRRYIDVGLQMYARQDSDGLRVVLHRKRSPIESRDVNRVKNCLADLGWAYETTLELTKGVWVGRFVGFSILG